MTEMQNLLDAVKGLKTDLDSATLLADTQNDRITEIKKDIVIVSTGYLQLEEDTRGADSAAAAAAAHNEELKRLRLELKQAQQDQKSAISDVSAAHETELEKLRSKLEQEKNDEIHAVLEASAAHETELEKLRSKLEQAQREKNDEIHAALEASAAHNATLERLRSKHWGEAVERHDAKMQISQLASQHSAALEAARVQYHIDLKGQQLKQNMLLLNFVKSIKWLDKNDKIYNLTVNGPITWKKIVDDGTTEEHYEITKKEWVWHKNEVRPEYGTFTRTATLRNILVYWHLRILEEEKQTAPSEEFAAIFTPQQKTLMKEYHDELAAALQSKPPKQRRIFYPQNWLDTEDNALQGLKFFKNDGGLRNFLSFFVSDDGAINEAAAELFELVQKASLNKPFLLDGSVIE